LKRNIDIELTLQAKIPEIPKQYGNIYQRACSGDEITVKTWRPTWLKNYAAAKDRFKDFGEHSYGQLYGINRHKPAMVLGSGPSLRYSIKALQENKKREYPVKSVSCLHNFGLLEDEGCHADFYLSLDSGGVVIEDISEARNKDGNFYWNETKNHNLIAYAASDPRLFDLWQGKIYLFNCLLPDLTLRDELNKIERFSHYISSGGNALGACMYTAKAIMGSSEIIYVGADFCFDYDNKFHSYKTHYDDIDGKGIGEVTYWPDVFGNRRSCWPSYLNFKFFMDWVTFNVPGLWASASEGILGSYPEGNIDRIFYAPLSYILEKYRIAEEVTINSFKIENGVRQTLLDENGKPKISNMGLTEFFKDSKNPMEITLF